MITERLDRMYRPALKLEIQTDYNLREMIWLKHATTCPDCLQRISLAGEHLEDYDWFNHPVQVMELPDGVTPPCEHWCTGRKERYGQEEKNDSVR